MHLLLCAEDSEIEFDAELQEAFPGISTQRAGPLLWEIDFSLAPVPRLVLARQCLPRARLIQAESIRAWAGELVQATAGVLPDDQPWLLFIDPHYGARTGTRLGARAWHSARRSNPHRSAPAPGSQLAAETPPVAGADAGRQRCRLIREGVLDLLRQKRRHLRRQLRPEPEPFSPRHSLVQLLLTSPTTGYLSVALAPEPYDLSHLLWPFPKGAIPIASDRAAPSRAFAKLVEAERRLGRTIETGETCVDLGAAPGSWTYVAVQRGARVVAVDRAPLREDLRHHRLVQTSVSDAFRFRPPAPVDWLLCDIIAAPERTADLLVTWLRHRWCRHFVVTIKLKDTSCPDVLGRLKRDLPPLAPRLFLTRLCANKKEVCAFGSAPTD